MPEKVIVYNRLSTKTLEALKTKYDVTYFENIDPMNHLPFLNALKETEGIIGLELQVDAELLDHAPNLKIVSNVSTGYSNLDIEEMTKRNIMATNTPDVLEDTTADAIFGILLATARRIPEFDAYVKNGKWTEILTENQYGANVHHKKLGIIGMGKIGSLIAKRAHCGFDMEILYHNRARNREAEEKYNAIYCDLETLLKESHFVCLMTPLTPETENLIGEAAFKMMKRSCIFVNGSRGQTVDESALIEALQNGEIRAAGLDVFHQEPINPDNPLLKMDNVVATPHIGSSTDETELEMSEVAVKNLIAGLKGERPMNLVNGGVWPLRRV